MPNIDTNAIEGFEAMSAEQKVEALLKFEIPEAVDTSKFVSKEVFDKKASEAAALSKQLREKMTDDEAKKAEDEKKMSDVIAELEQLRKEKEISDLTNRYMNLGYSKELAADTAKAMQAGDMDKVFTNGEKHRQAMEKEIETRLMNSTHRPGGSGGEKDKDEEDLAIKKAKEIAKTRSGGGKNYAESIKNYY